MAKKPNRFNDGSNAKVEAGAPGDEKPTPGVAVNKDGSIKLKKNGDPWKQRAKNTVNPKIAEFRNGQKQALVDFVAGLKANWEKFSKNLKTEQKVSAAAARAEKKLLALSPEEREWMRKLLAAEKRVEIHADPEPEQRSNG